ncbi:MAG: hypothetical protein ACP5JN_01265 [Candidatus Micrarchaeia archaeon]|jgi:hypothetical protein
MYYDILHFDVDKDIARLLGFKKIYVIGKDVLLNEEGNYIIADDFSIHKFRSSSIVGVRINKQSNAVFQKIKEEDKIGIIDISPLLQSSNANFLREYKRLKNILLNALHAKLKVSIATFAKDEGGLLSSAQMLEIAKFLGAPENKAKEAISRAII